MTLEQIKAAIADGKTVYYQSESYEVIKDTIGQYLIQHVNGHCIGLTWTDEVTMNGKESDFYTKSLTFDDIKGEMEKRYWLISIDQRDSLSESMEAIQQCIHDGSMQALELEQDEVLTDWRDQGMRHAIDELRKNVQSSFDLEDAELDALFYDFDEEIKDEIHDRDESTPLHDLIRATSAPVMFFDTGLRVNGYYDDPGSQVWDIKEKLGLCSWDGEDAVDNPEFDKAIKEMVLNASYGGRLVVYFRGELEDWLYSTDKAYNTITFKGNVSIALVDHQGGSGGDCSIKHTFTLPFNRQNVFIDKLIKYNYTYSVCGMNSDWCEDTEYELSVVEDAPVAERSAVNNHLDREAAYNAAFKAGGCTRGDTDMKRHRKVEYGNDFPCGWTCGDCGHFWVD